MASMLNTGNVILSGILRSRSTLVPLAVLIALVASTGLIIPGGVSYRGLIRILVDAVPLLLLVIGATLPILIGSIDLSVGGMAALAGVLLVELYPYCGAVTPLVILLICALLGALQGSILAFTQIPSFVKSLGTLGILGGF